MLQDKTRFSVCCECGGTDFNAHTEPHCPFFVEEEQPKVVMSELSLAYGPRDANGSPVEE